MTDSKILREIRNKEEKTEVDEIALRYYGALATISEYLVSASKWHIDDTKAVAKIREIIRDTIE